MKFLSIYKTGKQKRAAFSGRNEKMGKLIEEGMKAGWLLAVEGCLPSARKGRASESRTGRRP